MSIVLVSHDMGVIAQTCDRVAVMYAGHIVEVATVGDLFARPEHPYTRALLAAMPRIDGGATRGELQAIPGQPPDVRELPPGCPSRCVALTRERAASRSPWSSSPSGSTTSLPVRSCGQRAGWPRRAPARGPSDERPLRPCRGSKWFPMRRSVGEWARRVPRSGAGRRRSGVARPRPAGGARHRRRVRERQDDPRPLPEPASRAERGQHRLRRDGRPCGRPEELRAGGAGYRWCSRIRIRR